MSGIQSLFLDQNKPSQKVIAKYCGVRTLIEKFDVVGIQLIYWLIFFHLLTNLQFNDISLDRLFFKKFNESA